MARIRVAIPCFGGNIQVACMRSVMELADVLRANGHEFVFDTVINESLIQRARNALVVEFLKDLTATHLFFIDADIVFRAADVLGMLEADKSVVCGAYSKKSLNLDALREAVEAGHPDPISQAGEFAINATKADAKGGDVVVDVDKGCVPIHDAATGFLLIKRHVLMDMIAAYPEKLHYSNFPRNRGEPLWALFDCAIEDYNYLSEDYYFSRRWQDLGGTVWLDLRVQLGHIGIHTYRGDLFKTFRPVPPVSSTTPDGGATEWCDIPALPNSDDQKGFHIERYEWASAYIRGFRVANAACGTNYGSMILRKDHPERQIVGFDRSVEALKTAKAYRLDTCHVENLETVPLTGFDAVVSCETLEHLQDPFGWLQQLDEGVKELVVTCPIIPTKHANKFHLHDFTEAQVIDMVERAGFAIEHKEYQDEYVPKAVLLVYAVRQ